MTYKRKSKLPTYRQISSEVGLRPAAVQKTDERFLTALIESIMSEEEPLTLLTELCSHLEVEPEKVARLLSEDQKKILESDIIGP